MDSIHWLSLLQEFAFLIGTFSFFIILALWKGIYLLIKCIIGMYISLLLVTNFPFFAVLPAGLFTSIILFIILTLGSIYLLRQHIPSDTYEKMFENFGKKILLASLATLLLLVIGYETLGLAELVNARSTFDAFFTEQIDFFWWLLIPLVILTFL